MDSILQFFDIVFHLDRHLADIAALPLWMVYAFFFAIIFVETGVVVMPFLPGDSFLFVVGTFVAINNVEGGHVDLASVMGLLVLAAVLGDTLNYHIGQYIGPRAFHFQDSRWFNKKALHVAHVFYEKHGGKTIIIARFMPFIRTFAPFVAGIGTMPYRRFLMFNVTGAVLWVGIFISAGYFFGQIEWVQHHFTKVMLLIVLISLLPLLVAWAQQRFFQKS